MALTDLSIRHPVSVAVGVILVVLFGVIALFNVPIQLTPDIDEPRITVQTIWPGASPEEVEQEIVDRQEEQLKGVESLVEMTSESEDGSGSIVLEFQLGMDIDAATLKVANKLQQVQEAPELAEKPVISTVDSRAGAITWMVLQHQPGNTQDINSYRDLCEDVLQPAFERVPGVARCNIFGGTERKISVTIDPKKLSAHRLTVDQVARALQLENRDISAGDFDEGKRRYVVRTLGEFNSPEEVESVVVLQRGTQSVYVRDIGEARLDYFEPLFTVRRLGLPSIAMNCQRTSGANVLETMKGIKGTLADLNDGILKNEGLKLEQVYDETVYIYSALHLVQQNIVVGGILAITVLFLFLRSRSSVFIIATAIPISIAGTFLAMYALGRNINVISLAGMSFAVGMVVDNAIVVLENIYRHRQLGKERRDAASRGTREVWGAILASTLTTMAVFVPIVFMKEEIGQLYRDIALAISSAVALSMIVSITVIPTLAARIMGGVKPVSSVGAEGLAAVDHRARRFTQGFADLVYRLSARTSTRLGIAAIFTTVAIGVGWLLAPPAEYLPQGNRNLVFGIMLPPPGYNLEELAGIGLHIESKLKPYFPEYAGEKLSDQEDPKLEHFFFVARGRSVFMGARAKHPKDIRKVIPLMQEAVSDVPGMIAIISQSSLFGRGIGEGRNIDLEITGPDMNVLVGLAGRTFGQLKGLLPSSQMRPIPSLDLGNPEVSITPDRDRLAAAGLSTEQLGIAVDVFLDGRKIDDYKYLGEEIDLVLEGKERYASRSQDFSLLPVSTPDGRLVTVGDLAEIEVTSGPEQINHIERRRAITISIVPPEDLPLETVMDTLRREVVEPLERSGEIGTVYQMKLAGTADDLDVTRRALQGNLVLAMVIAYLLMAALFESFLYPLVIMFSVPLAAVGGFIGLRFVNLFTLQPLDTLTMLGFIILIGTVVNNAILIVHQSLNHMRDESMSSREAIREAVRTRVRPIFMSTTTTVLGMLPLVIFPGAGSELYRGIGSVVIGGLIMSTLFSLVLIPTLFSLALDMQQALSARLRSWRTA